MSFVAHFMCCSLSVRRTQGPVKYSCTDFWWMVWEQHASGIVMLNQIHELVGPLACVYYIYVYVYMYVYMYTCIYICVCVCIYYYYYYFILYMYMYI